MGLWSLRASRPTTPTPNGFCVFRRIVSHIRKAAAYIAEECGIIALYIILSTRLPAPLKRRAYNATFRRQPSLPTVSVRRGFYFAGDSALGVSHDAFGGRSPPKAEFTSERSERVR